MKTLAAAVLLIFITSAFNAEPGDPVQLIRKKDNELQGLLKKGKILSSPARKKRTKELINGIFDFQELGQKEFVEAFQSMIEHSSLKKLEVYKSDSTRYSEPEYNSKKDRVKITARTYLDGQESVLVYKMHLKDGQWRAWDLVIDDLSTYRNYKEQFKRKLKTKTIDDLIQLLKDKSKE